ncbi:hypothetical protein [Parapedobacter deserti]|uniref:hypothetical protein n=1 Tax=Parapedobacter deserti TaxID=1912957 RepID=UPI003672AEFD
MVVIAVPVVYATHTHDETADRLEAHGDCGQGHDHDTEDCSLCEFYIRYFPKDAEPASSFGFRASVAPLAKSLVNRPRCQVLFNGLQNVHINRGPPSSLTVPNP